MTNIIKNKGCVAGIDYGTVRIGVAISDVERLMAFPFDNYSRCNISKDAKYFADFAIQQQIVQFVVGLPLHLDGRISEKAKEAIEFGNWLNTITGIPVDYYDERYTSSEAEQVLLSVDMSRKKRKKRLDKIAAQILLTAYLETGCIGIDQPYPIDD